MYRKQALRHWQWLKPFLAWHLPIRFEVKGISVCKCSPLFQALRNNPFLTKALEKVIINFVI